MYDEPVENLDEVGVEGLVEFFKAVAKERETVLVIAHLPALQARIPNTIRVVKEGGSSRIEG